MRFRPFPKAERKAPSKQRLAAARKALQRERDRAGLFVDELGPRETAEERVARQDEAFHRHWQKLRDHTARQWREARRILFSLPPEERRRIRDEWRACAWPGTPEYFLEFLKWQSNSKRWGYEGSPETLWEASFMKDQPVKKAEAVVEEQLSLF